MNTNQNFYFIRHKYRSTDWTIAKYVDKIDCFITFDSEVYHWSEVEVSKNNIEFPMDIVIDDTYSIDEIFGI